MTWRCLPLKRIASIRVSNVDKKSVDGEPSVRLCNYTDVYYRDFIDPRQDFMRATASPEQVAAFRLKPGDIVITKDSESVDDIGIPTFVQESASDLVCGYHLAVIRPRQRIVSGRFLFWVMASSSTRSQFEVAATGITRFGLRTDAIGNAALDLPPLPMQRAIADFLDAETARIDALMAKKRKQSALIDDRWIAFVTDRVRGSHIASVYCRASGVDWIGKLPEEWGTPSIGMMFDVELGKMLDQRVAEGGNQRPYLRNQNVQWDSFDLKDVATMHFEPDEYERFTVRKGDLLVCEGGDVGRAAMWSSDTDIHYQKALHRVRPRTTAPPRFLMYILWAAASLGVFTIEGNQSTIVHLTREQLRAHRVPWPPEEQQRQIVAELDKARAKMRDIQERWARQISLLVEHRQALITAAVTGQLEIPGVAA